MRWPPHDLGAFSLIEAIREWPCVVESLFPGGLIKRPDMVVPIVLG